MLYHITLQPAWDCVQNAESFRTESLESEGFIHCSKLDQVLRTANKYFRGVDHLLVLVLDEERLTARLVWENTSGGQEPFPHLYGALNLQAVVATAGLISNEMGEFVALDAEVQSR